MEAIVKLKNIYKYYGKEIKTFALKNIHLQINKGEMICIMGPSGSGKTSLLNILGLIDLPALEYPCEYLFMNQNVLSYDDRKLSMIRSQYIGFIFQSFNLIDVLTVKENILISLINYKLTKKEKEERISYFLERVGLKGYENRKPLQLSGGQQQRVGIVRALAKTPSLVLCDEITANLDSKTSESILQLIKEINQELKTTFVFATHDSMVLNYVNKVFYLRDGMLQS